ncbi:MAG TPA: LysM peptidoglycan-binding domain-containing protein, partial [Usitatibacter sp.]|nr:LysM peptidoglycan-binding domain-containing protein [Usitatibacter sp.]
SKVTMSDLAANAPDTYTVVKGDTLWGIAGKFLKDPWKWPQIWEMNRDEIKNPHWIYPGNVIRLDKTGANPRLSLEGGASGTGGPSGGTEADAQGNVVVLNPRTRVENLEAAVPTIPGNAIGPFLSQPLIIESGALDGAPTILATEESRVVVGPGDLAYADRVASTDGVNWQVYRPGDALRDPDTNEVLGIEAKYLGDARVRRFGNPTTLEITKARQEITRGDRMAPSRETSFPSYVPHAPDKLLDGTIMTVEGGVQEVGQFDIITINRGARDGIEVGYVLASYHRGAVVNANGETHASDLALGFKPSSWFSGWGGWGNWNTKPVSPVPDAPNTPAPGTEKAGAKLSGGAIKLPDERNGLVFVFRVFEKMSYALVMKANKPIYVGDIVRTP